VGRSHKASPRSRTKKGKGALGGAKGKQEECSWGRVAKGQDDSSPLFAPLEQGIDKA